jgi:hypothetical protein
MSSKVPNELELKDHARFVAMFMLKHAPQFIASWDWDQIYDKAIADYKAMISRVGDHFDPPEGFKEIVIAGVKAKLPFFVVERRDVLKSA